MARIMLMFLIVMATVVGSFVLYGCNSSPTVPVPPPEMCGATAPDAAGMVQVSCEQGKTVRDVALVYNTNWGQGVMQETEEDGSFVIEIEADNGDIIEIQIKNGDRLSAMVTVTVPN